MPSQLQYSETELRKQINRKPKEYLLALILQALWHMATYLQQEFICRCIRKIHAVRNKII